MRFAAPAKVNLFLHVLGRKPDGYHLLESVFALVDLADTLTVRVRDDGRLVRDRDTPGVPESDDLAMRAARRLQAQTGTPLGASIAVDKRIPTGAGLGGGSSDAASVLVALNHLWRTGLPREALAAIALELGADVPFFVLGRHALVRGIGERLFPVSLPSLWVALGIPAVAVPTAAIFADPNLTRSTPSAKMEVFSESYGRNDLEQVASARFPEVAATLAAMRSVAPQARMTGSGACIIAACASRAEAETVVAALPAGVEGRVMRTLSRHPLAGLR
jgi:4-diphosphocytidyl-2-C-methyl-D-erythritol kinase